MLINEIKVTPYRYVINKKEDNNGAIRYYGRFKTKDESVITVLLSIQEKNGSLSFSRDGAYEVTNQGDQFRVLYTVMEVIKTVLPIANKAEELDQLEFTADVDEPSRVKLYKNKVVPMISEILGSEWNGPTVDTKMDDVYFTWELK